MTSTYKEWALAHGADGETRRMDGVAVLQMERCGMLEKDVVVASSFAPYSQKMVGIVEGAKGRSPMIAVSDNVLGPVARNADLILQILKAKVQGFRSLPASMCLAQTLTIGMAAENDQRDRNKGVKAADRVPPTAHSGRSLLAISELMKLEMQASPLPETV